MAAVVLLSTAVVIVTPGSLTTELFSDHDVKSAEQKISTEQITIDIHYEVNEVRKLHGLDPFNWSNTIAEIAKKHSQDMSERDYLSHISPEGYDVADRYEQANFVCDRKLPTGEILKGGENLAEVSFPGDITSIGERIVESWMDSPTHRENLLFSGYGIEGIGVVLSRDMLYITQNFC